MERAEEGEPPVLGATPSAAPLPQPQPEPEPEPEPEPFLPLERARYLEPVCEPGELRSTGTFQTLPDSNYKKIVLDRPSERDHDWRATVPAVLGLQDGACRGPPQDLSREGSQEQALLKYRRLLAQGKFDELAVLVWTFGDELNLPMVYKDVNNALLRDSPEDLAKYKEFMSSVNRYIEEQPAVREEFALFRGTTIAAGQRIEPTDATVFRQPWYMAASTDEDQAAQFAAERENSPIIKYIVPAGFTRCAPLHEALSAFPREHEWLIMPYTAAKYVGQEEREFPAGGGQQRLVVTFELLEEHAVPPRSRSHVMVCKASPLFRGRCRTAGLVDAGAQLGQTSREITARALVIGIADYKFNKLRNSVNDAEALAARLEQLGFAVQLVTDRTEAPGTVSKACMDAKIRHFADLLDKRTVAVFAFMGHGVECSSENFLLPQEQVEDDKRLARWAVNVQSVIADFGSSEPLATLVFLDCCREPVTMTGSTRGTRVGLADLKSPAGTLVMYATAPKEKAEDGVGDHGVFTEAMLKHMSTPNLSIYDLMTRVTSSVKEKTDGRQTPWISGSLLVENLCLVVDDTALGRTNTAQVEAAKTAEAQAIRTSQRLQEELLEKQEQHTAQVEAAKTAEAQAIRTSQRLQEELLEKQEQLEELKFCLDSDSPRGSLGSARPQHEPEPEPDVQQPDTNPVSFWDGTWEVQWSNSRAVFKTDTIIVAGGCWKVSGDHRLYHLDLSDPSNPRIVWPPKEEGGKPTGLQTANVPGALSKLLSPGFQVTWGTDRGQTIVWRRQNAAVGAALSLDGSHRQQQQQDRTPKIPTGVVVIKSAWPRAAGELLYCGATTLNAKRRHVLTWIGGAQPPTAPPGGELWDIQPTKNGHYTIKSAWPGAAGELLYCGATTLNAGRRHVLTRVGGARPRTTPPGGELWDIQPTKTGHYTIKSAWPGAAGELLYCGATALNAGRRHVLTWIGGARPPTTPPGGELWEVLPAKQ